MKDPSPDERLRDEIALLRAQNRRYRERIQSLSSTSDILRKRLEAVCPNSVELRAFETYGRDPEPKAGFLTGSIGVGEFIHPAEKDHTHETPEKLKPLAPNAGWKCLAVDQPQLRIGFTLFGMTPEGIEDAVEAVEQRQVRSRDFTPVFVTDSSDLGSFRSRGYVVEYVPASIILIAESGQVEQKYLKARLGLIRAKWNLGDLVDLGTSHGCLGT